MKKTLLITGMVPGDGNVGEILIKEMLACKGIEKVSLAALVTEDHFARRDSERLLSQQCFVPPAEFARRDAPGLKGTLTTIYDRLKRYEPAIKKLSQDVLRFIEKESPEQIWFILNSTVSIDVAANVSKAIDIPMLAHVWDDPRHIMMQRKLDRFTVARTMKRFNRLLKKADRLGLICEQMADEYAKESDAPAVIIQHGLQDTVEPRDMPSSGSEFRIGLSGSMYCYSAWKALLLALDQMQWRIGSKRIILIVAGSNIHFQAFVPAEARFYGWRPTDEVVEMLGDCDVLYLPHPFEGLQEPLARFSFPTKLSTYVGTGRPIFLHAPTYSSLTDFSNKYEFGLLSNEINPDAIARLLQETFQNADTMAHLSKATADIGSTVLTRSNFQRSVEEFLKPE